ncbi:cation diffusion facilitator family transporter TDEL_0B01060 [Torulaspora delbrueckii]|uniref:Uncharacterized protein n=1 Tax=Torulaspora delbrueckii TaxID=4950 RepID=G8ZNP1_TORDE|nr:hypothetical protein TDEL_0B01060 [Torulaspora delbrueckii]CCE90235.1 hypothetical protein TDEL_0B01060 [Torulaspora delbrueckii]
MKLSGKEIRICSLLALDSVFFLLELIIGYMSHSLALIADSFHMLNDIISLLVALWAVDVAKNRNPDASYTYGWKRAEILGALINAVFLIALCFTILIEALQRLISPPVIENPKLVMYVGIAGLLSNLVGLVLFHDHGHSHGHSHGGSGEHDEEAAGHSHSHFYQSADGSEDSRASIDHSSTNIHEVWPQAVVERFSNEGTALLGAKKGDNALKKKSKKAVRSLNMHGVFLHVLGDALGNVGVIVAALFIWKTDYSWKFYCDPVVSLVITVIIFSSAIPLSRKCSRILLQATPSTISADAVQREVLSVPGVRSVHDFHIWNLTESFFIASLHVQIDSTPAQFSTIAKSIRSIFHNHGIHSATVQPEFVSGDVSEDASRRFSLMAGGTPDISEEESASSTVQDPSPSAYGSTARGDRCLVDRAANCNADECLPK